MASRLFRFLLLSIFALSISGCRKNSKSISISNNFKPVAGALQFYVFGDWGRNGEHHQRDLAIAMDSAAHHVEPEFIISTGDNFYPDGVASVNDPQWASSFENIYTGESLHCPWYVVPGNHDYQGSVQAEIDYSNISRRWHMPDRYFTFLRREGDVIVRFVFIDTTPFQKEYYSEDKYRAGVVGQDTLRQKVWLDSVLSRNDSDWKIVSGHHPFYSGGKRAGDVNTVRESLEPVLTKNNVDVYFAGHEHDLQHIKPEEKSTHHFISGAGSEIRPTGMFPYSKFGQSVQGFMAVFILKNEMKVQVMDYHGSLLYQFTLKKKV